MDKENTLKISDDLFIKCLYAAYLTVSPTWCYSDEKTECCNLVLICGGEGLFTCNNQQYIVKEGDIVFFPAGVKRIMQSNGGTLMFRSINFTYCFVEEKQHQWVTENHKLPFEFIRHIADQSLFRRIEHLFIQIQKYYMIQREICSFHMRYYATELIHLLLTDNKNNVSFSEQNMVDQSVQYMSAHFKEKITLEELAELSGKSISHYGKIFKKITGVSPIEYLLSIRISYAKRLLETGFSITETAQMSGFASLYYFSKAFKKKEYISPSEYINIFKRTNS